MVKNPPVRQETQETRVQSQGGEDPLEEGMATHCSILAWESPWTQALGRLQSKGYTELNRTEATKLQQQHGDMP